MLIGQLVRSLIKYQPQTIRSGVLQSYRNRCEIRNEPPTVKSNVPGQKEQLRKPKEWFSLGASLDDYYTDRYTVHCIGFLTITLCMCGGCFVYLFLPDWNRRNWAKREAFILLNQRERAGLPPIDMNYVDPKLVILPSEEELENVEIII